MTTPYPPAAQLIFSAGALVGGVFGVKFVLIMLDLAICFIILKLLKRRNLSNNRAILYAWHPLPVLEIGASGHIDAAAVFFLFSALILFVPADNHLNRAQARDFNPAPGRFACGIMIAFSVLTKWFPLVFLPGFFFRDNKNKKALTFLGFFLSAFLLTIVFLPEFTNSFQTLGTYLQHWEFSGLLFRCLRTMTGSGLVARFIIAVLFIGISVSVYLGLLKNRHPDLIFKQFYTITFAYLVLTPTLHPWYALYLVAFLPFCGGVAGIVFSWSVFLSYRVLIPYHLTGLWIEDSFPPMLIIAAPAAAVSAARISRLLANKLISKQSVKT